MLSVPASSPITLEAEAFEILSKENIIRALGRAQARWQKAEVVTQNLSYEQVGKIIRLEKNVKIKYNDIQAQGDRGDYLIERQEVKLSGNAEAEQGDNRLTGNQVLVSLKDQKISLLGKGQVIIGE
jgi:lipopolysaccharide export system protein LptA